MEFQEGGDFTSVADELDERKKLETLSQQVLMIKEILDDEKTRLSKEKTEAEELALEKGLTLPPLVGGHFSTCPMARPTVPFTLCSTPLLSPVTVNPHPYKACPNGVVISETKLREQRATSNQSCVETGSSRQFQDERNEKTAALERRISELDSLCKLEMEEMDHSMKKLAALNQIMSDWKVEKQEESNAYKNGKSSRRVSCSKLNFEESVNSISQVINDVKYSETSLPYRSLLNKCKLQHNTSKITIDQVNTSRITILEVDSSRTNLNEPESFEDIISRIVDKANAELADLKDFADNAFKDSGLLTNLKSLDS